jgi:hypothetical protein
LIFFESWNAAIEEQFIYAQGCNPARQALEIVQQEGIS